MISKFFNRMKSAKALCIGAVCLLALVLLTAGIAWRVAGADNNLYITYQYADPKGATLYNPRFDANGQTAAPPLFASQSMYFAKNANGSATLVGAGYSKTFRAAVTNTWFYAAADQLDDETYYLDTPTTGQGVQWAYTFTGWHIVATGTENLFIPMETVFQPGDVIPKEILDKYAPNNSDSNRLVFEPLWGRCYFVQNAKDASGNLTGTQTADNMNLGNSPATPLPSLENVYRVRSNPDNKYGSAIGAPLSQIIGYSDFDAYKHAIMLTGDLELNNDNGKFPMFSNYVWPHATTIKSLQATRANNGTLSPSSGKKHTLTFNVTEFSVAEYQIFSSTRFDNIYYLQKRNPIFEIRDGYNNEVQPGSETVIKNNHYFETTARFSTATTTGTNLYIRAYTCEKIVLNGGTFGGVYLAWNLPANYTQDNGFVHTWYFGRNVNITGNALLGVQSDTETIGGYSSNDRITITGGVINRLYGAGAAANDNAIVTGNREYYLYGNGGASTEYNPQIGEFYGGGQNFKINGNITINANGCTKLGNFYCGGQNFPAAVTGNITSTFNACTFSGTLSGGGRYADTKGDVSLRLLGGSKVGNNVYGSGEGFINTFTVTVGDVHGEAPSDWQTPPQFTPVAEKQSDGSYWILTNVYKRLGQLTGKEGTEAGIRYMTFKEYKYLSEAKANNVSIEINNSTVTKNVYGGGYYASVLGDVNILVTGSSASVGSVYGGSDASTPVGTVTLYNAINKEEQGYAAPVPTANWLIPANNMQSPVHGAEIDSDGNGPDKFSWSNDTALLEGGIDGIDYANEKIYTNTTGGTIHGDTDVQVVNGAKVTGYVYGGGNSGAIKGGTDVTISGSVGQSVYGGCSKADVAKDVKITVNAGATIGWYIFGGNDSGGIIGGNITTVMNGGTVREDIYGASRETAFGNTSTIIINGGTVENDIFGGGFTGNAGNTVVTVEGGMIKGNVYAGGDNATVNSTQLNINGGNLTFEATEDALGNTYPVYGIFGGGRNGAVLGDAGTSLTITGGTIRHQVFGGGYGANATVAKTYVNIDGGTYYGAIYGGGYSGKVTGLATVDVTSTNWVFPSDGNKIKDGRIYALFGGGFRGSVGATNVIINGGGSCAILADTYGGGYEGAVTGESKIDVKQRYTQYKTADSRGLFGGGYGVNATVGSVVIDIANIAPLEQACIYGGGNQGAVNGDVLITIDQIATSGHIYGGGMNAAVGGDVVLNVSNYSTHGDDSSPENSIYGGGRDGAVNGNTTVTLSDCVVQGTVCGGGFGTTATVGGNTNVTVDATAQGLCTTKNIYGGGLRGNVFGNTNVLLNPNANIKGTVYGGGNEADVGGSTNLHAKSYFIHNLFGGCTTADVDGDTNVTLYDGAHVDLHLYGGNQTSGDIGGKTTVTVKGGTVDGYVFGGGQNATTDATTYVIIEGGNVCVNDGNNEKGGVFGGGFQAGVGNTNVTIKGGTVGSDAWAGSVYGGSYGAGSQVTSTTVNMIDGTVKGNVYGGGYSGAVDTNTAVTVSGGMATNAFGGGNMGNVDGNTVLKVTDGELTAAFGGNDTSGRINGNITVDVEGGTIGQLYGGGSKAHIDADITDSITLNIKGGTITDGFGGGMLAYTALTPKVTVTGGNVGTLYGGGSQAATIGSDVTVNHGTIGTLYGGGYAGAVINTKLQIDDGTSGVITINGNVYGGGEGITATVNESTNVTINMDCSFTATETSITTATQSTSSGAVTTEVTNLTHRSTINGNVYGGGNLGRVGEGIIYVGGESAKVTSSGTTNVLVNNGYIGGSVFAGGRGIPGAGQAYDASMGTIFGTTDATVNGGYIGGNLYGGGEQSRVYSNDKAASVLIKEVADKSIAINGSVFGGGDRGDANATNASVPTVIGDVHVSISGYQADVPSNIYFLKGGVYGDGNLCLVKGQRTIDITNFKSSGTKLKTFYSLQRADNVTMDNSAVVLLGAIDLVAENDERIYSINRIGSLDMIHGSTVKLDQIVNYLGDLTSDVHADRKYIHMGNNGTNGYTEGGCDSSCLEPLTTQQITNYQNNVEGHNSNDKNVICVANGLYLEVKNEAGIYGPVNGLFTLQLLYANPGEGGGFVYGSIPESTGDFICETKMSTYKIATVANQAALDAGRFYVRSAGLGYAPAPATYDAGQTYYTALVSDQYMEIIDDVGGYENSSYSYYYWYIGGPEVRYDISITGYIGAGSAQQSVNVPQHDGKLAYVLYSVDVNDILAEALSNGTYTLMSNADSLTGNQIAIEIKLGSDRLGFLTKVGENWAISDKIGYRGTSDAANANKLIVKAVDQANDTITWILHKSADVNVETKGMAVLLDIDKFEVNAQDMPTNVVTESATLSFSTYISIVKLLPTQYLYHDNLRSYTGVGASSAITITGNSCFTAEYQTNYIPAAFPNGSASMAWTLTAENAGKPIPAGTKITMVDLSGDVPTYYYYICSSDTTSIDLTSFMQMGTKQTIASMGSKPAFYNAYANQDMALFNERLLFVFDFEQASKNISADPYANSIVLHHIYDGKDIMDYTKEGGEVFKPKTIEFNVSKGANGVGEFDATFDADAYADNETAILNVTVSENEEWVNTLFREYGLAVQVDLTNATSMPAGMYISYLGQKFYPGADSTVISVPIYEFGSHELQICNPHGGLAASLSDSSNVAKFEVSFYCAPDAQYHNVYNTGESASDSFTVADGILTALQIVPANGPGQILSNGQTLSFRINTDSQAQLFAIGTQTVEVKLLYKENGVYNAVDIGAVFNGTSNTVRSGDQQWKVTGGEPGTYRIVFNYANNTEYLNFIIQ